MTSAVTVVYSVGLRGLLPHSRTLAATRRRTPLSFSSTWSSSPKMGFYHLQQRSPAPRRKRLIIRAARTESQGVSLGFRAPHFELPEPLTGKMWNLEDFESYPGLLADLPQELTSTGRFEQLNLIEEQRMKALHHTQSYQRRIAKAKLSLSIRRRRWTREVFSPKTRRAGKPLLLIVGQQGSERGSGTARLGTRSLQSLVQNHSDFRAEGNQSKERKPALVMFICNHCPFVKHLKKDIVKLANFYMKKGLAVVAISSNSVATHPQDGPEFMAEEAKLFNYPFPYLYDESQDVARDFGAVCTPEFFLFKKDGRRPFELVYHGQFDASRPSNNLPVTGRDISFAIECVLSGQPISAVQKPSVGCSIKWHPEKIQ
ncbi:hypothetical protein JRO89_XS07G0215200 [Xanthoceras sorbifolium]|uniref:Thioredoxin domain-containing protein n=1 Tax=Xanthoceras sorbifolium TaxID=99658 RepID=A0ABQ8HUL1_9ROSI|nr:hypothetical protein JRO89_XS07G0215200 [Xanthoceras sorbifolium]